MEECSIEEILVQKRTLLLSHAMKILRHREDAEDALNSATMRLLAARGQFEGRSAYLTYAVKTLRNECFQIMRTNGRLRQRHDNFAIDCPKAVQAIEWSDAQAAQRTLHQALDRLESTTLRTTAVALLHHETSKDTAASLGITTKALKTRTFRLRRELKRVLNAEAR